MQSFQMRQQLIHSWTNCWKDAAAQGRSQQVATPDTCDRWWWQCCRWKCSFFRNGNQSCYLPQPQLLKATRQAEWTQAILALVFKVLVCHFNENLSRVPYNQAALDDVNNPAWTFNPGILEKVLKIARERGHIVGDQYILERVKYYQRQWLLQPL